MVPYDAPRFAMLKISGLAVHGCGTIVIIYDPSAWVVHWCHLVWLG